MAQKESTLSAYVNIEITGNRNEIVSPSNGEISNDVKEDIERIIEDNGFTCLWPISRVDLEEDVKTLLCSASVAVIFHDFHAGICSLLDDKPVALIEWSPSLNSSDPYKKKIEKEASAKIPDLSDIERELSNFLKTVSKSIPPEEKKAKDQIQSALEFLKLLQPKQVAPI